MDIQQDDQEESPFSFEMPCLPQSGAGQHTSKHMVDQGGLGGRVYTRVYPRV